MGLWPWRMEEAFVCRVASEFFSVMGSRRWGACTGRTELLHSKSSIARRSASGLRSRCCLDRNTSSLLWVGLLFSSFGSGASSVLGLMIEAS